MQLFKEMEFGESSSENEAAKIPELVTDGYYDGTAWVNIALNSDRFLFLGTKGSGKSALLSYIHFQRSHDRFTTFINLDSFPFSNFTTAGFTGALGKERVLPESWNWLLVFQLLWSFKEDLSVSPSDEYMRLMDKLEEIGFSMPSNLDDVVVQTRKSKSTIHGPSLDLSNFTGIDTSITSFKYESTNQGKDLRFGHLYRSHLSFSLRSLAQPAEDPVALVA